VKKSLEKPLKIEFWTGKKFIGITTTTITDIREGKTKYILRDPSVPNENRGNLLIKKYEEIVWFTEEVTRRINSVPLRLVQNFFYLNPFSSMHYLGFHKFHLSIAVDYTITNGLLPTKNKKSYHYIGEKDKKNPYEVSLSAIMLSVFQFNDQVNSALFGFGHIKKKQKDDNYWTIQKGKRTPLGIIEVKKKKKDALGKLLSAYRQATKKVQLGVNFDFRQIIEEVAEDSMSSHSYNILCIVLIRDIPSKSYLSYLKSCQATFRSGMSIVFIGIGKSMFTNIKKIQTECTNITFVRYIDHQIKLGVRALRKVPQQVKDYYASRKEAPEIMGHVDYFS